MHQNGSKLQISEFDGIQFRESQPDKKDDTVSVLSSSFPLGQIPPQRFFLISLPIAVRVSLNLEKEVDEWTSWFRTKAVPTLNLTRIKIKEDVRRKEKSMRVPEFSWRWSQGRQTSVDAFHKFGRDEWFFHMLGRVCCV